MIGLKPKPKADQPEPAKVAPTPTPDPTLPAQPKVRGESEYDRVTSGLMAVIVGAGVVVAWLSLVYLTNRAFAMHTAAPIQIIEVYGGGGGAPDGEEGSTEKIDVSDAEESAFASNNELQSTDFEEPSVQQTESSMVDAMMETTDQMGDLADEMPSGGATATGRRSSKIGTGGPAYGFGAGDGGVPREQRWSVLYNKGQTLEEYARQLDFFQVEMATIVNNQMHYVSNFSAPRPTVRVGSGRGEDRLYFLWQGGERKESDVALLKKAGIDVGARSAIFQFYKKGVEDVLSQLEVRYKGRNPAEIRVTRFTVIPSGRSYAFQVIDQQPLH
jgi:hypothetical protein